ncbi:MAG: hypothetical protein HKN50_06175 [Gammaproteobacteria bacterium]|nr:hypothetical protein [Gammaproteobacteria bacterium]
MTPGKQSRALLHFLVASSLVSHALLLTAQEPSAVDEEPSAVNREPSAVNTESSATHQEPSAVNTESSATHQEPPEVNRQPATLAAATFTDTDYSWELKRDKDGIQIFTSVVPDSPYKAVKAVTTANASVRSAVALVMDFGACSKWAEYCKKSYVLEQQDPFTAYVYTLNDLPFPVKNRHVTAVVHWFVADAGRQVQMISHAVTDRAIPDINAIRLQQATAEWRFVEETNGILRIESYAHIDPNGVTPAWLTNMLLVDSPFKTLEKMRAIIESGQYDQAKVEFLP